MKKDRQYYGEKKKDKRKNNSQQINTQNIKDWTAQTFALLKSRVNSGVGKYQSFAHVQTELLIKVKHNCTYM